MSSNNGDDTSMLAALALVEVGDSVRVVAQQAAPRFLPVTPMAPLFFREPWRQTRPIDESTGFRPEAGITPGAVTNPDLELRLYDPGAKNVPAYLKNPPPGSRSWPTGTDPRASSWLATTRIRPRRRSWPGSRPIAELVDGCLPDAGGRDAPSPAESGQPDRSCPHQVGDPHLRLSCGPPCREAGGRHVAGRGLRGRGAQRYSGSSSVLSSRSPGSAGCRWRSFAW